LKPLPTSTAAQPRLPMGHPANALPVFQKTECRESAPA
jgi:hypothetical protein